MINVNQSEFRPGNVVTHRDIGLITLTAYDISRFGNPKKTEWQDKISMTELTEELIIKFGFIQRDIGHFVHNSILRDDTGEYVEFRIAYHNGIWHCALSCQEKGFLFRQLKYLHELQNTFFGLSGEDIKEGK